MQHYHLDIEGIPEYTNALEDTQKRSKWAGNTITSATLLLIATNAMLSTERFSCSEKIWEELRKDRNYWYAWKNVYKTAD